MGLLPFFNLEAPADGPRFIGLGVVLLLAVAVPLLFGRLRRIRVPVVVGEIIAGILVGVSGLNLVPSDDVFLNLLSEIGFVFLMFLAGMEIELRALGFAAGVDKNNASPKSANGNGPGPLRLALEHFGATLVFSAVVAFLLWKMGMTQNVALMALVLSTTSLGVVMPVLKERGLLGGRYGQTLLVSALVADFATMFLITLQVAVISKGITPEILLVGALFVAVFLLYRLGIFVLPWMRPLLDELSHATTQIRIRLAFLLMVAFVALAELVGAEVILGAFLAGLLVSMLSDGEDEHLKYTLESIGYGFFVPIFFIMVGVKFDLAVITQTAGAGFLLLLLIVSAFLIKVLPAGLFLRAFPWKASLAGGMLLSARLSLIIAAAEIGWEMGVLSELVVVAVVLVAIITVTVSPLVFTYLVKDMAVPAERPVLVIGANALGLQMARHLQAHKEQVVVLDEDPKQVEAARKEGLTAHRVAPSVAEIRPYFEAATAVIVAYTDPKDALRWAKLARQVFGVERVLALAADATTRAQLQALGALCVSPLEAQATFMALMARNPDLLHLLTSTQDRQDILELVIRNPSLDGKRLRDLGFPPQVLVLAVHRGGEYIIPRGDTRLRVGDVLTVLGTLEELEQVKARLGAAPSWVRGG